MSRNKQRLGGEIANLKGFPVRNQAVKLRAVLPESWFKVKDAFEDRLNGCNTAADQSVAAQLLLEIGRCRQVISMCVGLDDPFHFEAVILDKPNHLVCRRCAGATGLGVIVQDRVDDGAG